MRMRNIALAALTLACLAPSMAVNLDHVVGHNSGLRLFALAATAVMSVAAAAMIPFTMRTSLQGGRRMEALGLALMLALCWGFNVANGVGASSTSRADATGGRAAGADRLEQLRADVAKLEAHRVALAKTAGERTAGMIDAELAALRQAVRWSLTKGCTANVAADASREFCADYARLQGARDAAAKVEVIDANLEAMRKELRGATTADTASPADPKAASIASGVLILAGLQVDPVAVGVALDWLQALVLELIASMGPVIATATLGLDKAAPATPTAPVRTAAIETARRARRRPRRRHRMWAKLARRPGAMPALIASPAPLAAAPAAFPQALPPAAVEPIQRARKAAKPAPASKAKAARAQPSKRPAQDMVKAVRKAVRAVEKQGAQGAREQGAQGGAHHVSAQGAQGAQSQGAHMVGAHGQLLKSKENSNVVPFAAQGAQGGAHAVREQGAQEPADQSRACAELAARGMSQAAIAKELGVSRRTVSRWIEAAAKPASEVIPDASPAPDREGVAGDVERP